MPVLGTPRNYYKKFSFLVEIAGVASAKFQKAGPLKMTIANIKQSEGGALTPEKQPGMVEYDDITLERGATSDLDFWNWVKQVANVGANTGVLNDIYKRTIDLVQLERDGTELQRWTLHDAWPVEFQPGDWDNSANENVIEMVKLTYKYFEPVTDNGSTADAFS
jgi:phage tail-like protein